MPEETIYAVVLFHNQDEVDISPFRSRDDAVAAMIETAKGEVGNLDEESYAEFSVGDEEFEDADEALEALANTKDPYIFTINGDDDNVEITLKELTLK